MLEVALSVVIFVAAVVASGHAVASKPRIFRLIPSIFPLVSLWKKTAGVAAKQGDLLHAEELLQEATVFCKQHTGFLPMITPMTRSSRP
jgi:hypothetical protein